MFLTWSVIDKRNNADDNLIKLIPNKSSQFPDDCLIHFHIFGAVQSTGIQ